MFKTVYENDYFVVKETGRNYDFGAVIENKTDKKITLDFYDLESVTVEPSTWTGLLACDYYTTMDSPDYSYGVAIENGDFDVKEV